MQSLKNTQQLSDLVGGFITKRHISRQQYKQLSDMVLADGSIDEYERQQINRLHDAIQEGRVKVVDQP